MTDRRFDGNPCFSPEDCGLRMIGSLEDENLSYSFNTLLVVRDIATGDLYAAHDSGCSCPCPFEDVHSLADMTLIRSLDDLKTFLHSCECEGWLSSDRQSLYRKTRRALVS